MSENAFKNWINPTLIKKIGKAFHKADSTFDQKRFGKISSQLSKLELKERVLAITEGLRVELSGNYLVDKKIIEKVLSQKSLTGFELWPDFRIYFTIWH